MTDHTDGSALDDLARRFTSCALPKNEWTHEAHLAVGLWHVARYGDAEALVRLRRGIRRLNESHGTANSDTGGYHETITGAYVALLALFLRACPPRTTGPDAVAHLLASPLAHRDVLLTFYSRERLMSRAARGTWVEPDVQALSLTVLQH